ncbi:hypothetical protein [Actinomadura sp. 9N407]|uniref:hypothetical protein n=1 Tax=Actinomadura sp. 9N407 TaxID=3375154 RepID=UPI0037BDEC00
MHPASMPWSRRARTALVPLLAVPILAMALSACGEGEATMPPLTPEPGDQRPSTQTAVPAAQSLAARKVLYQYLRGIAAGDAKVCSHLTPGYESATFGAAGDCRKGLDEAKGKLRPQDVTALRGVTVPTAEAGPENGDITVGFEDLKWKGEPARPGGILAARYTLRQTGGRWLITG